MDIDSKALEHYKDSFLRLFPEGEGFNHPEYLRTERNYKDELCELFNTELASHFPILPRDDDELVQLADGLLSLFRRNLKSNKNKSQNLVDWRYVKFDGLLDDASKIRFAGEIGALLDESTSLQDRVDDFQAALAEIVTAFDKKPIPAMKRSVTSFFLFLFNPNKYVFVKTNEFKRSMNDLIGAHVLDKPDEYSNVLSFVNAVRKVLESNGWKPKDFIDIQSFLWVHQHEREYAAGDIEFSVAVAEEYLDNRYGYRKEPTQYIAAFETDSGRQMALGRTRERVQLWVEAYKENLAGVEHYRDYDENDGRSSNLKSQAPTLAPGNNASILTFASLDALSAFCDWYETNDSIQPNSDSNIHRPKTMVAPLNQILYGPPGTGKTFHTVNKALAILDPDYLSSNQDNRQALKSRFDELKEEGRAGFVTFHQSFSYEDFVEGLRAATDANGQVQYRVEDGIFKRMCLAASVRTNVLSDEKVPIEGKRIWKMSLGNTLESEADVFDECIERNVAVLGWGDHIDFSSAKGREDIRHSFTNAGQDVSETHYSIKAVNIFLHKVTVGDLVVVTDGNYKYRAIGEVRGEYSLLDEPVADRFWQAREVNWLQIYDPSLPHDTLMKKIFSQQSIYELKPSSIDMQKLDRLLNRRTATTRKSENAYYKGQGFGRGYTVESVSDEVLIVQKPNGSSIPFLMSMLRELADLVKADKITLDDVRGGSVFDKVDSGLEKFIVNGYKNVLPAIVEQLLDSGTETVPARNSTNDDSKVLIIDEINRGNISSIFGELITLIEPSKRSGEVESIELTLPYSKESFCVPNNLYIIGTMNTADRSLAHIDTALRRRFEFEGMLPDVDVLRALGIEDIEGVDVPLMLATMNKRIEILYDREHTLGHSFFIPLLDSATLDALSRIFATNIFPLLEEYFFEDWSRIRQILGDDVKTDTAKCFYLPSYSEKDVEKLLGSDHSGSLSEKIFYRNYDALADAASYVGIYERTQSVGA